MSEHVDRRIAVIGAGTMGRGIVQVLAVSGHAVQVHDQSEEAAHEAVAFCTRMIERAVAKGRMSAAEGAAATARMSVAPTVDALAGCDMAIEAVAEVLEVKRALFARLEGVLGGEAVLATNTSSLSVSAIAAGVSDPSRVVGLHFFNPVPLMPVVEVIAGLKTGAPAVEAALEVADRIGYRAIRCKDAPGFLINHAGRGLTTEGIRIVQDCVAREADVDRVMREAAGFRMGPFELLDLMGLDVSLPVLRLIYEQFYHEPRYRPGVHLAARVAAGLHGRKTGEGFYRYGDSGKQEPEEAEPPEGEDRPLWVPPAMRGDVAGPLAGLTLDDGERPGADSVIVVAPWGQDATATAAALGLDAARLVALDPLFAEAPRVTIMGTPATEKAALDAVHRALRGAGRRVTVIEDSPGFIAQRILATIVNIGCEIAQMQIATPADIDDGVRLGLGYPAGPLTLGDRIGPARVLEILRAMQALTGDPRYRPSLWLQRRVTLGMPLAAGKG